jgi:hypothetical protein
MVSNRRRTVHRVVLALAAIQVVLTVVLFGVSRSQASALPDAPDVDVIDLPVPNLALTISSGVERANEVALAWQDDARLSFVSLQVDWATTPPPETVTSVSPFGWLRLVYVAPVEGAESDYAALSLLFERMSGALVEAEVSPWHIEPSGPDLLDTIQVTEETALLAAEISGGTAYRAACPDLRSHSTISIATDSVSGEPVWHIGYRERGRDASGTMRLEVNAVSGAVSVSREAPAGCGAGA